MKGIECAFGFKTVKHQTGDILTRVFRQPALEVTILKRQDDGGIQYAFGPAGGKFKNAKRGHNRKIKRGLLSKRRGKISLYRPFFH